MSTAALLRQALEDAAPPLHVAVDHYDDRLVLRDDDGIVLLRQNDMSGDGHPALRLLGLLLAAAPHLAGMLNASERDDLTDEQVTVVTLDALDKMRAAITDAFKAAGIEVQP